MSAVPKHRQPIIDTAVKLFRQRGYAGTGLNDLVEESGAPKGSLYYYFPKGKPSIAVAAVEEAGRRVCETVQDLSQKASSTGALLKAHAALLMKWMAHSGYRDGCPITTVLLELAPQDRAIAEAGKQAYAARVSLVRDKLVADGFPAPRAKRLASLCVSSLQGALIQARVERSGAALEAAADELAQMLAGEMRRHATSRGLRSGRRGRDD